METFLDILAAVIIKGFLGLVWIVVGCGVLMLLALFIGELIYHLMTALAIVGVIAIFAGFIGMLIWADKRQGGYI